MVHTRNYEYTPIYLTYLTTLHYLLMDPTPFLITVPKQMGRLNWFGGSIILMSYYTLVTPLTFQPFKRNQNRKGREEIRMLHEKKGT